MQFVRNSLKYKPVATQKKTVSVCRLLISCHIFAPDSGIFTFRSIVSMIFSKPLAQRYRLLGFLLFLPFTFINAQEGKSLFQQNCQSCHALDKRLTGPALRGAMSRGPWGDRKNLYA